MLPEQDGEDKLHGTISLPNSNSKGFHNTRGLKHSKRYYTMTTGYVLSRFQRHSL